MVEKGLGHQVTEMVMTGVPVGRGEGGVDVSEKVLHDVLYPQGSPVTMFGKWWKWKVGHSRPKGSEGRPRHHP